MNSQKDDIKKGKTVGEGGWEEDGTSLGYLRFEMTTCDG